MNTDIRLAIGFFDHPKIARLERTLGWKATKSLIILWQWVACNKPSGILDGADELDIAIMARWSGDSKKFVSTLLELRLLDKTSGGYSIHNWVKRNPWAADAQNRSDMARLSALKRWNPDIHKKLETMGINGISREDYHQIKNATALPPHMLTHMGTHCDPIGGPYAPDPNPDPDPEPDPIPDPDPKSILDTVEGNLTIFGEEGGVAPDNPGIPECPHQKIIDIYGEVLPGLPQPQTWGPERQKFLRARWVEDQARRDLDWWRQYFHRVSRMPFLNGHNERGWRADLVWLVRPTNMGKVLDGVYKMDGGSDRYDDLAAKDPDEILDDFFRSVRDTPEFIEAEGRTLNDEG